MKSHNIKLWLIDILLITAGTFLYSLAFVCFIEPNLISPGGVTGLATVVNYYFDFFPVGSVMLLLNIPLLIFGYVKFKGVFIIKTSISTVFSSVFIDVLNFLLPTYKGDKILACLAGGVIAGAGLSLVIIRGGTTGGTDIVAKLINNITPFFSIGRILLFADIVVVSVSTIAYKQFETALYSVLFLFVSSTVIDKILIGKDKAKLICIITKNPEILMLVLLENVGRGVTQLSATGGFTSAEQKILLCAVRPYEINKVTSLIKQNDIQAFVMVTDVGEVLGEGFNKIKDR